VTERAPWRARSQRRHGRSQRGARAAVVRPPRRSRPLRCGSAAAGALASRVLPPCLFSSALCSPPLPPPRSTAPSRSRCCCSSSAHRPWPASAARDPSFRLTPLSLSLSLSAGFHLFLARAPPGSPALLLRLLRTHSPSLPPRPTSGAPLHSQLPVARRASCCHIAVVACRALAPLRPRTRPGRL
jgi:hypothetical protein